MRGLHAACLALALAGLWQAAAAAGIPKTGHAAPAFTLARATSGTLSLDQLRGKPVYLNFFASWCGPCASEAPAVARLSEKYVSRGLVTIGVNELEDKTKALDFVNQYHLPYIVIMDEDGAMGQSYGANLGLPVHAFIARNGRLSTLRIGQMDDAAIEAAIKRIL